MPLAFDSLSPTFCAGTRKLVTAYAGQCVRLDIVGTPTNFGFSGLDFDKAAMEAAVGVNSGDLLTFFDQSGNTRDMTKAAPTGAMRAGGTTFLVGARCCVRSISGVVCSHPVVTLADLITNSAATILWAGIADTITSNDVADPSANFAAFRDNFGVIGGSFRSTGVAQAWNDDNTTWDFAETPIEFGVPLMLAWRHKAGNIEINVNGGGWVLDASGNTRAVAGSLSFGAINGTFRHAELATFATALADADVETWGAEAASYWGGAWGSDADPWAAMRYPARSPSSSPADRERILRTTQRLED